MRGLLAMATSSPVTRFTQSHDVSIAYQVTGNGPADLVLVPGFVSHLEQNWLNPFVAQFLERLASFSRLIMFDKRGTGLSDRSVGTPSLGERMDDIRAVMDAVGSRRAVLMGVSEGAPMGILFAATYPQRVSALILYGGMARGSWAPDYPWAGTPEQQNLWCEVCRREWGGPVDVEVWAPSMAGNDRFRQWFAMYMRLASSPRELMNLIRMNIEIDVRANYPHFASRPWFSTAQPTEPSTSSTGDISPGTFRAQNTSNWRGRITSGIWATSTR
jgi:pimeloyl-ACP methyl ester carboxylesterase